jgi:hypothetical protein
VFVEGNRWMMEEEKARDGVHLTKRSAKVLGELLERVGDSMFRRPNERSA